MRNLSTVLQKLSLITQFKIQVLLQITGCRKMLGKMPACISAAEISNCIIAIQTVTCMIGTERSTNITVTESITCTVAIEPQNFHNCDRRCHLYNCY